MPAPAAEEHTVDAQLLRDGVRVLALPLPRRSAPDQERYRGVEPGPRPSIGAHEERDALEAEVAPDEQEQRQRLASGARERVQRLRRVADASRSPRLVPALGLVDEPPAQEAETLLARERRPVKRSVSTPFGITSISSSGTPRRRTASDASWGEMQMMRPLRRAAASRRAGPVLAVAVSRQVRLLQQLAVRVRTAGGRRRAHLSRRRPRARRGSCRARRPRRRGARCGRASSGRCRAGA